MECPKWQFENREGAKFCSECGHKFELTCPECGVTNRVGSKFCDECGYDLGRSKEASPIDYSRPQSYTPNFLAEKILTTRSAMEGERKLVTVLFADVANYTSISEKLDPEEIHQIMDGCFKILLDEIHKYEGTINQFTGDGVMALFGAPLALEDHAQRACHAALSIQRALINYGEQIQKAFGIVFKMRIGLNSGPVIVGAIGDDLRMDYTAIEDTTNLASRIESIATPGSILVSDKTFKMTGDFFEFKYHGTVHLKGKEKVQQVYELVKPSVIDSRLEASVAKGLTKFVGRKKSTAALNEAMNKALSDSGQVVGVVGEAGVGKSRLILESKRSLQNDKVYFLEGKCFHYCATIAYLPVLDIIKNYLDIQKGDSETLIKQKMSDKILQLDGNLQTCVAPLQELLSIKVEDESFNQLKPQNKKERIFEAYRDIFIRESQKQPLIIVFEDLHWIDRTSEQLIDYFIGWLANSAILLVLLYRPEYTHQWGSKSYYNKIGLDHLSDKSRTKMIKAILNDCEIETELERQILKRAAGNPLFIEELMHNLLENSSIQKKDNQCVLSKGANIIQVPDSLQGIIAHRIDHTKETLKSIIQEASVIGRIFAFRILQAITKTREELKSHLFNLQGLEFIYEKSLFPELEYIFKHALTQEVAYNSLLSKKKQKIHEKIGRAIEQLYPDRLEEFYEVLAHHYVFGENVAKAYHYLKASGLKAMRYNSAWEALSCYNKAIAILDQVPADLEQKNKKLETLYLSISILISLGFPENSLALLEQGERLSEELEDERKLFRFRTNIGVYYSTSGNYIKARPFVEQAFDAAEKLQDIELMSQVIPDLYTVYLAAGEHMKSIDVMSFVIDLIEKNQRKDDFFGGPTNIYAILHSFFGLCLAWTVNFKRALTFFEKSNLQATAINDARTLSVYHRMFGGALVLKGELKHAKEQLESAIMYNEKLQHTPSMPHSYSWLGLACALAGDSETGRRQAEKGLKIQSDTGYKFLGSIGWFCLGVCLA